VLREHEPSKQQHLWCASCFARHQEPRRVFCMLPFSCTTAPACFCSKHRYRHGVGLINKTVNSHCFNQGCLAQAPCSCSACQPHVIRTRSSNAPVTGPAVFAGLMLCAPVGFCTALTVEHSKVCLYLLVRLLVAKQARMHCLKVAPPHTGASCPSESDVLSKTPMRHATVRAARKLQMKHMEHYQPVTSPLK